jgi:stearoyl-CoA desaturase (Delta-9 desaturase)
VGFQHRSFACTPVIRWLLGGAGSMEAQRPLLYWVSTHRVHHQNADRNGDPHSPHAVAFSPDRLLRRWFHAHIGWAFHYRNADYARVVPDLLADPIAMSIQRHTGRWLTAGLILPAVAVALWRGSWDGLLTGFLWCGLVRVFLLQHVTWSINSICHLFGTRPFETSDQSRNHAFCAIAGIGEGWHNNHHAFPNSARLGLRWWEVDPGYWLIRLLALCGLATDVRSPTAEQQDARSICPLHK